LYCTRKCVGE
jgi:hypothetical protein